MILYLPIILFFLYNILKKMTEISGFFNFSNIEDNLNDVNNNKTNKNFIEPKSNFNSCEIKNRNLDLLTKISPEKKIKNLENENSQLKYQIHLLNEKIKQLNDKVKKYENMLGINDNNILQNNIINNNIKIINQKENDILNSLNSISFDNYSLQNNINENQQFPVFDQNFQLKKNNNNIYNPLNLNNINIRNNFDNINNTFIPNNYNYNINFSSKNNYNNPFIPMNNTSYKQNNHFNPFQIKKESNIFQKNVFSSVNLEERNNDSSISNNSYNNSFIDDIDVDNMTYEQILELENKIGNVSKGLSTEQKLCLKIEHYSPQKFEWKECVICKETFNEKNVVRILHCKHIFHPQCIDIWFKDNKICPICKKEVAI